jgi:hypothetical protein
MTGLAGKLTRYSLHMSRLHFWTLAFLVALFGSSDLGAIPRYLQITKENVNIRAAPTTRSQTVGRANQGDIFELAGERGGWYEILLFSGEFRYVHQSLAQPVSYQPEAPGEEDVRRQIFTDLVLATRRAEEEANQTFPPNEDFRRNLEHERLLNDRYKLELMHRHQIQPPVCRRIVIEGDQKGW